MINCAVCGQIYDERMVHKCADEIVSRFIPTLLDPRPNHVTRADVHEVMERVFHDCNKFREAGQMEYAHDEGNALANFERVAASVDVPREKVLWTYMEKHLDGIKSHIKGHRSQREPVYGRIRDVIVYLCLLESMFRQDESSNKEPNYG